MADLDAAVAASEYVSAVAHNSAGRYGEALVAARQAVRAAGGRGVTGWALAELVEAAVRTGRFDEARSAHQRLDAEVRAVGSDLALGIRALSAAMLTDGAAAETAYREAIERLGRDGPGADALRARAHLAYGEWLRRRHRPSDARTQLRRARDLFVAAGATGAVGFVERARRELLATGEHREPARALTPQEAEVVRLAARGWTNPEIAGALYLSPRTVEYHLHKVFLKLGVTSRRHLRTFQPKEVMT